MKRIICLFLMTVLLVGCSNRAQTPEGGEKVVLKVGLPGGSNLTPPKIIESFKEEHPNIILEIDETPWGEFKRKLKMQIGGGNPPTVFVMDSGFVATMGAEGALVDLTDKVKNDMNADEYSSTLFSGVDANGGLWGLPHGINSVAVYYNKELFDNAGLLYPEPDWTFDDMLEMAEKLTKKDGATEQYGINYGAITEGWLPFIAAAGGAPLDETRKKSMFKDPKTIDGLEKYVQPYIDGIAPNSEWLAANGNALAAFYTGKIGMIIAQSSAVKTINTNAPEGFRYDVQMLPIGWDGNRHCVYVPNQWSIYERASDAEKEAAWQFVKHFMGEESQRTIAETLLAGFPVKLSALGSIGEKEMTPTNMKAFYEGLEENGITLYENKTFEEWRPKVDEITKNMRNGLISFDQGIEEIEKEVTKVLENE